MYVCRVSDSSDYLHLEAGDRNRVYLSVERWRGTSVLIVQTNVETITLCDPEESQTQKATSKVCNLAQ